MRASRLMVRGIQLNGGGASLAQLCAAEPQLERKSLLRSDFALLRLTAVLMHLRCNATGGFRYIHRHSVNSYANDIPITLLIES